MRLSDVISDRWPEVELPPRPCPGCSEPMTEGRIIAGQHIYGHALVCPAAIERSRRLEAEKHRAALRRLALEAANVPSDPRGIGDLASYIEQFGQTGSFAMGVGLCIQFLTATRAGRAPQTGFTLCGRLGSGKTTLAASLARSLVDRGVRLRFETGPELYNRVRGLVRDGGHLDAAISELATIPVLFLDDLGREKPSPWWVDQVLFPIVDERYRNGLPIVATTNHTWSELEQRLSSAVSERGEVSDSGPMIRDRLEEIAPLVAFGPDESLRRPRWEWLETDGERDERRAALPEAGSA